MTELHELQALHSDLGDWNAVLQWLASELESTPAPAARRGVLVALATVHSEQLGQHAEAAELLEQALELIDELGPDERSSIADRLIRVYEAAEDWDAVCSLLLETLEGAPDPAARMTTMLRIADVYETRLHRSDAAVLLLERLVEEQPGSAARAELERLYLEHRSAESFAAWLTALSARVAADRGEAATLPILLDIGRIHLDHARNADLAEAFFSRVTAIDERNETALVGLASVYEANGDWTSFVETAAGLAAVTSDTRLLNSLRRKLADAWLTQLHNPANAVPWLRARAEQTREPEDERALLDALRLAGDHSALQTELETRFAALPDPETGLELATLLATELARPSDALRVLTECPTSDATQLAISALGVELARRLDDTPAFVAFARRRVALAPSSAAEEEAWLQLVCELADTLSGALLRPDEAVAELEGAESRVGPRVPLLLRRSALQSAAGRWTEALAAEQSLADLVPDTQSRARHLQRAAALARDGLGEPAQAVALLRLASEADPSSDSVAAELGAALALVGDAEGYRNSLQARISASSDDSERARLKLELARATRPVDVVTTVTLLRSLLQRADLGAQAFDLLIETLSEAGDWSTIADEYLGLATRERDLASRSRALAQAALVQRDRLGALDDAIATLEHAVDLNPENVGALQDLAVHYGRTGQWEKVRAHLTSVDASLFPPEFRTERLLLLAAACESLHLDDEAIAALFAYGADHPDDWNTTLRLARLYGRAGRHDEALASVRVLVESSLSHAERDERVEIHTLGATAAQALGRTAEVREHAQRIVELDPANTFAQRVLATSDDTTGTDAFLQSRFTLFQLATDNTERLRHALELAHRLRTEQRVEEAMAWLQTALQIDPSSVTALTRLLEIHRAQENWGGTADVLLQLANVELDATRRVRYLFAAAAVYRDQLGDPANAVEIYNLILDADPTQIEAFQALDECLAEREDWVTLEVNYRRMLTRLVAWPADAADQLRFAISRSLGKLHRDRLGNADEALHHFRKARSLNPEDVETLTAIAEIYPSTGKSDDEAISQHQELTRVAPDHVASYYSLLYAYRRKKDLDRAWLAASALVVLGDREKLPRQVYDELRPPSVAVAGRALSAAEWRLIVDDRMSQAMTRLMAAIATHARRLVSADIRDHGLQKKRDWVDTAEITPVNNLFHYATQVFNIPMPALYRLPEGSLVRNLNTDPLSVGLGADILTGAVDRRVVFHIVRAVSWLHPDLYLASALTVAQLRALVSALLELFAAQPLPGVDQAASRPWLEALRREPEAVLLSLRAALQTFLASGEDFDVASWASYAECSALNGAMLLCGDLPRAFHALSEIGELRGELDTRDAALRVVRFATSSVHANLRRELGLGVGNR